MESLSQIDVSNPDHISVITREGKVTISVMKDGASVTLGFPIKDIFNVSAPIQLQQDVVIPVMKTKTKAKVKSRPKATKPTELLAKAVSGRSGNHKLTPADVREIKEILANKAMIEKMGSRKKAYDSLAKAYGVTCFCIKAIDNGATWGWLKV
jgi:hypothetical protein